MEELKEIATIIGKLGEQGTTAFIWWLILDKGLSALVSLSWMGALMFIVTRIARGLVGAITKVDEVDR